MQQYLGVLLTPKMSTETETKPRIKKSEYVKWKKGVVFDQLKGQKFGPSFCQRFGIEDALLYFNTMNPDQAEKYIKKTYLS